MDKYLEYYMDYKIYTEEEVQKSIEKTKKEFSGKEVNANVEINDYGVYIITFRIKNKYNFFQKILIKIKMKFKKKEKMLLSDKKYEKYSNIQYGIYKQTITYKPY